MKLMIVDPDGAVVGGANTLLGCWRRLADATDGEYTWRDIAARATPLRGVPDGYQVIVLDGPYQVLPPTEIEEVTDA